MKRLLYLLAACLTLSFAGCSSEPDIDLDTYGGNGLEFVHFESSSDAWLVTESDESYDFEVAVACTYTHAENISYNIEVGENTTGVEGTDFSIPVKSVTINAGEYLGKLPVSVLYETTGEGFTLELVLSVDDALVNEVYGKTATITVKSDKITIDWDWLEGNWTAQDESGGDPYVMSITKTDETHAVFNNIWGTSADMAGVVDFDARTVTFKGPYNLGPAYGGSLMVAHIGDSGYDDGEFYAVLSPLGITISGMGYYLAGGPNDGYDFGADVTVLTR